MFLLKYYSIFGNLIPVIAGLLFKTYNHKILKSVFYLYVWYFIYTSVLKIYAKLYHNNMFMVRYYALVEIFFLSYYFYQVFETKFKKQISFTGFLLFIIFLACDLIYGDIKQSPNYLMAFTGVLYTVYSFIVLYQFFTKNETDDLLTIPNFWIVSSILVFFGGTFILWLFSRLFLIESRVNKSLGVFQLVVVFETFNYIGMVIGFWKQKKMNEAQPKINKNTNLRI